MGTKPIIALFSPCKSSIITVRKRSCGKVMFLHLSVSHSVHRRVCLSACWDTPTLGRHHPLGRHLPLGRHPPRADTPLPSACCDTHTPAKCMLGYTPLPSACWDRHGYCCGRYASYWNAFLFNKQFTQSFTSNKSQVRMDLKDLYFV